MNWSFLHWRKAATLYLHFPCFDGVVSGVLAVLFLEKSRGWKFTTIKPVNYHSKETWLETPLPKRSAVVDFLYHPRAEFWADHHSTTFLTDEVKASFEERKGPARIYDRQSGSCACLLWREIGVSLAPNARLEEMVRWAQKIDSAAYESVDEAFSTDHPALIIRSSLAVDDDPDPEYCRFLVTTLRTASLQEVAQTKQVQERFVKARQLTAKGLERMRQLKAVRLAGDVVVFNVNREAVLVDRYVGFLFHPQARYSVGVIHSDKGTTVTAMRNPWLDFESANLGEFMRQFGGGGHQRVGALILPKDRESESEEVVSRLLNDLRQETQMKA